MTDWGISIAEIKLRITTAQRDLKYWQGILDSKSCKECVHFVANGCKLADGVRPPPEIEKVGCDEWRWDDIPF